MGEKRRRRRRVSRQCSVCCTNYKSTDNRQHRRIEIVYKEGGRYTQAGAREPSNFHVKEIEERREPATEQKGGGKEGKFNKF